METLELLPSSPTKASFQKRKEMREGLEGFFFLPPLSFTSSSIQPGIEEMFEGKERVEERPKV